MKLRKAKGNAAATIHSRPISKNPPVARKHTKLKVVSESWSFKLNRRSAPRKLDAANKARKPTPKGIKAHIEDVA
jgi:hypothetical protein